MPLFSHVRYALERLWSAARPDADGSVEVRDRQVLDAFTADPANPFLVSFPRTGSHWVRMLMELYFERPSLTRVFFYPDETRYLSFHHHDLDLTLERANVLYLYRDPVDTVFSQLNYHGLGTNHRHAIVDWSVRYGAHLDKWLLGDAAAARKTILRYETLRSDLPGEFAKICAHFGEDLDEPRLLAVANRITKDDVKAKTRHDSRVVNTRRQYNDDRTRFRERHAALIWQALLEGREALRDAFPEYGIDEARRE